MCTVCNQMPCGCTTMDKDFAKVKQLYHALMLMTLGVSLPWVVAELGYWRLSYLAYSIGLVLGLCALMKVQKP